MTIFSKWAVSYSKEKGIIKIGCKEKTIKDWDEWFLSDDFFDTERNTEEFKRIQANYEAMKAYYLFMYE